MMSYQDGFTNGLLRAAEIALERSRLALPGKPTWAMENVYRGICQEAGVDPDDFERFFDDAPPQE